MWMLSHSTHMSRYTRGRHWYSRGGCHTCGGRWPDSCRLCRSRRGQSTSRRQSGQEKRTMFLSQPAHIVSRISTSVTGLGVSIVYHGRNKANIDKKQQWNTINTHTQHIYINDIYVVMEHCFVNIHRILLLGHYRCIYLTADSHTR